MTNDPKTARGPHGRTGERTPCGTETTCEINGPHRPHRPHGLRAYMGAGDARIHALHACNFSYARTYPCGLYALCAPMIYKEKREDLPVRSPVRPCAVPVQGEY